MAFKCLCLSLLISLPLTLFLTLYLFIFPDEVLCARNFLTINSCKYNALLILKVNYVIVFLITIKRKPEDSTRKYYEDTAQSGKEPEHISLSN